MATLILQGVGSLLGGAFGSLGQLFGPAVGATAGYAIDAALINSTRRREGPRLTGARVFTAEEGASLPRVYGTARIGGTLIWATRYEETSETNRRGGKGGPKVKEYRYFANVAFALCEGKIAGVRRVWADGQELDGEKVEMRVYPGSENQQPDPLIEAKQGEGNAPAYRGTAYAVFERLPIGDFGNRIPQMQFEVLRPVAEAAANLRAVALIPGSTEYGLSPTRVTSEKRPGETEALNRHVLHAQTDFTASLDELQAICPRLEHVALVVAWFGNDLRADQCAIRPAVTGRTVRGLSQPWRVSGLSRADAPLVSKHEDKFAYGGSPSDKSVIDAIGDLRKRGLKVTLYPFVMMDIPTGNGLPDPYGGEEQASYPWRGRITCHPAPLQPGSPDATDAIRPTIDAFCGAARTGDFTPAADTVHFFGSPKDWGYRRMVLHYAHLAKAAGGVDAFLIGSELRGLSTLRDGTHRFSFVEQLCGLAEDVRSVLGSDTKITYGADWSEYFGHHPQDGSGDLFFHLDPLWAHPAIDAVGIDNYMPLADWRDDDYAGTSPDGFTGPYDPRGLRRSIAGGEGFDWYYPDEAARNARLRSPISDGSHGKDWVFRYKDLAGWWGNRHHDRIAGVEREEPTAWIPGSKPIWLTEVGCPAVDKGPNQPNVFPDPKSVENALPHFSNGGRSDLAVHRFLAAHQRHWDDESQDFDEAANPMSPIYGGRMVDRSRIYAWAWDARPFPSFPLSADIWGDGPNWSLGHWLNGRLEGAPCGELIDAVLADHGLPAADAADVDGALLGYVVPDPCSARSALAPVVSLFGLSVLETPAGLVFRSAVNRNRPAAPVADLVVPENGQAVERTRMPEDELPAEAALEFRDPMLGYQTASARAVHGFGVAGRQETISFAGILERPVAQPLILDWLARQRTERDGISFAVPAQDGTAKPGAIIRLPGIAEGEFLVTEVEEGIVRRVSAHRFAGAAPSAASATLPPPPPKTGLPGRPLALLLDLPLPPGGGKQEEQFRLAAWSNPWLAQAAYASPENTGFVPRATLTRRATVGLLVEDLGAGGEGRLNHASVAVSLFSGELASISRGQLLNGANAAAILCRSGQWEVIQFQTAEEFEPSVWRLGHLLRGQLGTTDAMEAGAEAGTFFVLLDDAVQPAGLLGSECGLVLNWRVGPQAFDFSGEHYAQAAAAGGVRSAMPLAPCHLRHRRTPAGDLAVSWIRRSRIDGDNWIAEDIPVGEEFERYRVEIGLPEAPPLRSAVVNEPAFLYAAADISGDFPQPPPQIQIAVAQYSASVGWGVAARKRLTLA